MVTVEAAAVEVVWVVVASGVFPSDFPPIKVRHCKSNHRHSGLLRSRNERPRDSAAERGHQFPPRSCLC